MPITIVSSNYAHVTLVSVKTWSLKNKIGGGAKEVLSFGQTLLQITVLEAAVKLLFRNGSAS
jgi:hypothetical protein